MSGSIKRVSVMIKIGICDDDWKSAEAIQKYLELLGKKYQYKLELEVYASGEELICGYEEGNRFDLIYLDIEMKGIDGIETARWIREQHYHMILIYVSSYDTYLKQLFEVEPFRFLQKPVSLEAFEEVFLKAVQRIEEQKGEYFRFQSGRNMINLLCREILYIESAGRKVIVHTVNHTYEYYDKLDHVEEQLSAFRFVRIHKAYLVNMDNIEAFQYERLSLKDGTILNISEKNRPRIRSIFWNYCHGEDVNGG